MDVLGTAVLCSSEDDAECLFKGALSFSRNISSPNVSSSPNECDTVVKYPYISLHFIPIAFGSSETARLTVVIGKPKKP